MFATPLTRRVKNYCPTLPPLVVKSVFSGRSLLSFLSGGGGREHKAGNNGGEMSANVRGQDLRSGKHLWLANLWVFRPRTFWRWS